MSFPVDTPIGLLPYAVTPTGEVQFLFWKAHTTTPEHSATLYGDCIGVKDRFDQSMWDVCARTWAEKSGGLYAVSEELRLKREKKEKKDLKALQIAQGQEVVKDNKKDKKDKKDVKKDKKEKKEKTNVTPLNSLFPSITTYPTHQGIHNILYDAPTPVLTSTTDTTPTPEQTPTSSPQQQDQQLTLYSTDSKKFKHFQLIYKTYSPAQLIFNSTKLVRKLLTSRQSNVLTLTNDNISRPKFVYLIQIEFMPLWMVNYVVGQNGNGTCTWVHSYELIKYLSLDLLKGIPQEYHDQAITQINQGTTISNNKNRDQSYSPFSQNELKIELDKYEVALKKANGQAQITAQVEHEGVIFDTNLWDELVVKFKPPTAITTTKPISSEPTPDTITTTTTTTDTPTPETTPTTETEIITKPKIVVKSAIKINPKGMLSKLNIKGVKTTTNTTTTPNPQDEIPKKLTVPSNYNFNSILITNEDDEQKIDFNTYFLSQRDIPLNLPLLSTLTIDSLLKLTKMCNNQLSSTQSSPLYIANNTPNTTTTPQYIQSYDLPQYLIQYNDDRYNEANNDDEQSNNNTNKKFVLTPSQRTQLALDMQASTGYYKCRNCRHVLFAACHLLTHTRFDFDQHVEKAHAKHMQQTKSGLQPYRKALMELKLQLNKVDKSIRKYILNRRIQAEIASYEDDDEDYDDEMFDEDDDEDDEMGQQGDKLQKDQEDDDNQEEEEEEDDMFAIALRNRQLFRRQQRGGDDSDEEEDEDDDSKKKGLVMAEEMYDQGLLITYKECYDALDRYHREMNALGGFGPDDDDDDDENGVEIEDEGEFELRNTFVEQFKEYQSALYDYHQEKTRLDSMDITEHNHDMDDIDSSTQGDLLANTQQALNNFSEEKGTGVYVKPVFGKASAKGFTTNYENVCQSIFLDGSLDNFPPTLVPLDSSEGPILCRNCNHRCGNYSWSGTQCSCGQWVVPGLQIPLSRIDFSFRDRYGSAQQQQQQQQQQQASTVAPQLGVAVNNTNDPTTSTTLAPANQAPQHMPGPQPTTAGQQPQSTGLGNQIVGVRRLAANRPAVKKPGAK